MVVLATQNETFAETQLTGEEKQIFDAQWAELWHYPASYERKFIQGKLPIVLQLVQASKNALDEKKFGGFSCGNSEIGISPIRPGHVGLVNGRAPEADQVWKWKHDAVVPSSTTGFENWIHSPTAATTAFQVHKDACIIPLYIVEENCSPRIQCVKMDIGRADILYYDVCACRIRDYTSGINLIPLPTTFWGPEVDVLVALQHKYNGTTEPRLGGFTVALGTFLDATTYTASTNTVATSTVAAT